MQGHFDLALLDTPGLTQDVIDAVRCDGGDQRVKELLQSFKREGYWSTDNIVFQTTPSYLYYWALSAATAYGGMNAASGAGSNGLDFITLLSTASEPTYNGEVGTQYISWQNVTDNVGNTPSKLFWTGTIVTPDVKIDASGREAIYMKSKWLYLPGEATSSVIRSIGVFFCDFIGDRYSGSYVKTKVARVRIKDSGGNPVTISKTSTRSLLVEYTFTMPTL